MISRQEVIELAAEFGLEPNVVEKDYALGWLLAGFGQHEATRDTWIFKGGTCLKKCFFETYRFSEDLDFTLTNSEHLSETFLSGLFQEIADWVYDQCGLVFPSEARKVETYTNNRGGRSAEGRIGYRGPLARGGDAPRIKLDLTDDERLVLEPDTRQVHHPYSDRPQDGISVKTYAFEEVFAEKIRALAERLRPRDVYDVVHLHRHQELTPDRTIVRETLDAKCSFKGIAIPTFQSLATSPLLAALRVDWFQMLGHQLPQTPPFEDFWAELPRVFGWLETGTVPAALRAIEVPSAGALDSAWVAPAMGVSWRSFGTRAPLEVLRFAAANRLCVELDCRDESGRRSTRLIEPYALKRSRAGDILLHAIRVDSGQARSYRIDRVQDLSATTRPFTPRFAVEIAQGVQPPSEPPLPRLTRNFGSRGGSLGRRVTMGREPTHLYRCTVCNRTFRRKHYDATLRPHNSLSGRPCSGRVGIFVRTTY